MTQLIEGLSLVQRYQKPRTSGINMIIERGLDFSSFKSYLESCAPYIDYVKFTSGIALVDQAIDQKIELCNTYNIPTYCGGTLFEVFYLQNKIPEYIAFVRKKGINTIEISNGTTNAYFKDLIQSISIFKEAGFNVLVEIGSKDTDFVMAPSKWIEQMQLAMELGASKIILEGRESGKAGLYRGSGEIRTGLIDEIDGNFDLEHIIFEAPNKNAQCYLINEFGPNVNLGNIQIQDVNMLEVQRLGLRYDTFNLNFPNT